MKPVKKMTRTNTAASATPKADAMNAQPYTGLFVEALGNPESARLVIALFSLQWL
jgi:hypothetical protein